MQDDIVLFSTRTCSDCVRTKHWLQKHAITYTERFIDDDEAMVKKVLSLTGGDTRTPVLLFPDGSVMVEPTNEELRKRFAQNA